MHSALPTRIPTYAIHGMLDMRGERIGEGQRQHSCDGIPSKRQGVPLVLTRDASPVFPTSSGGAIWAWITGIHHRHPDRTRKTP
jgi:hypothetical protein